MKKLAKIALLLLAGVLVFSACDNPAGDDGEKNDNTSGVSFTSFSSPSIYVDNATGERLIAFKGSLNPNNIISGIPAYAQNHGLEKKAGLFTSTQSFPLVLVKEADYIANKNNVASITPFATIFAFYNHTATNNNRFQISSKVGGDAQLNVSNPTNYNVEIRKDGITGEVLGYVAANMTSGNIIRLMPEIYDIYPIFKFFIPGANNDEIYTVIPRYTDAGPLQNKPYMEQITFTQNILTRPFNVNAAFESGNFHWSSGGIYFRILNNSSVDVRVEQAGVPKNTSLGVPAVIQGSSETFTINITPNVDKSYPEEQSISGIKVGSTQNMLNVPLQQYKLDYMYEIQVTGTNNNNLTLGNVTEVGKIDLDSLLGN
jgi:hypothetical protein